LARLQTQGLIRRIGLCNVTVGQIEVARTIAEISAVQVSVSPLDDDSLRGGVAEYCHDHGIRLLCYRPLGGERAARLARDPILARIAAEHGVTPHQVALAWLLDLDRIVVPLPGATTPDTARSIGAAQAIALTEGNRELLDRHFPAGRLLRIPRAARQPPPNAEAEVVVVMGMPAAGKSGVALELAARGYARLNRDSRGGSLADLVSALAAGLESGQRQWVLDNTYPTRRSRNEVIEAAWAAGTPVRCIWVKTGIGDGQINAVNRLLAAHGRLPTPEELRAHGRADHRYFGPDAQYRYERALEPPVVGEGFTAGEERTFRRQPTTGRGGRAVVLELDSLFEGGTTDASGVLAGDPVIPAVRRETLARYLRDGWMLFAHAWRPQVGRGELGPDEIDRQLDRVREQLGLEIDLRYCPHVAGPPVCWCRMPLPGLVLEFAARNRLPVEDCLIVGRDPADRTLADRLGSPYLDQEGFFGGPPRESPARPAPSLGGPPADTDRAGCRGDA
jgi:hypothetical protein